MRLRDLVEEYGSPLYIYDLEKVREAHSALVAALPAPSTLYFSFKANRHPDVAGQLRALGCQAEISSMGEVDAAVAAGFDSPSTLYTAPGKTVQDIAYAIAHGVRRFSADSPIDLARIGDVAAAAQVQVECLLRVNADQPVQGIALRMTGVASHLGADFSWVMQNPEAFRASESKAAPLVGIHLYMGTNIEDENVLLRQFEVSVEMANALRKRLGIPLAAVDLGGGFGSPYAATDARPVFPNLRERLVPILDKNLPGWRTRAPEVIFESGRYLSATCGTFVCLALDVKVSKGQTFVVLESGIHHLSGLAALRRVPSVSPTMLLDGADARLVKDCTVVGPLCTPVDIWGRGLSLPEPRPGDLVYVPNVGAYGLAASLIAFHGHRIPAEIVIDGERVVSASQLELRRAPIAASAENQKRIQQHRKEISR